MSYANLIETEKSQTLHILRRAIGEESKATDTYDLLLKSILQLRDLAQGSVEERGFNEWAKMVEEIRLDEMHHQGILYSILEKLDPSGAKKFHQGLKGAGD